MGAANFGSAGMSAFTASRMTGIKGGNSNEPKDKYWWVPIVVAIISIGFVISLYFI